MKIAVNTRLLLSSRMEGICRYIHETLKRLVKEHPEDEFYFFFDRKYDPQFIYADNVTPIVLHPQARHPILWYWWFEQALPRAFKKYDIDVFYSGDTYMSLKTKVPTVLVCHDIAYLHYPEHIPYAALKYYKRNFPKFHKKATSIIAVSSFTKQDIVKQYQLDTNKVTVGYNSSKEGLRTLDSAQRQMVRNQYSEGKEYFIYLGSIHPRKNVGRLITAFNLFKKRTGSDKKLIIAGRLAWNVESFNQALKNSSYHEDIIHLEGLDNKEVVRLTAAALVMVYVSLFEGFGLPILEAFHCETPVICSNISSMPEVAGEAAMLVNPLNEEEISSAMVSLEANENLRMQLIQQGIKQREKFNWDNTVEITYQELAKAAKS